MTVSLTLVIGIAAATLMTACAQAPAESPASPSPTAVHTAVDPSVPLEEQLFQAVRAGDVNYVQALVDAGVDIDAELSPGNTALFMAVQRDDHALLTAVVAAGADVNQFNSSSHTALVVACRQGRSAAVIEILLNAGAAMDIAIPDEVRSFPIHVCSASGNPQAVETLVLHGADPNMRNEALEATPIIVASWRGDAAMVETLLRLGADPWLEDNEGRSAFDWAYSYQRSEVIEVLEAAGVA